MTRKEFEKLRISIEEEDFFGDYSNPIEYGIQRAAFEKRKFQKLIAVAQKLHFRTTLAKTKQWRRQLEKAEQSYERFKDLRKEIDAAKLTIEPALPRANSNKELRPSP